MLPFRRKRTLWAGAAVPAPCQVRSKTESPCPNLAIVEIWGVDFCGSCARKQEGYFAIGELVARGEAPGLRSRALAEALERVRRERAGRREGTAAETRHEPPDVHETERPALRAS